MTPLESSVVAILDAQHNVKGTGFVAGERLILTIDLARLRHLPRELRGVQPVEGTNALEAATRLAEEALRITERCGYVLQGADAHLELAKLALARNDKTSALEHARAARALATCDGPPDYTYKVAYEEAEEMLRELGAGSQA